MLKNIGSKTEKLVSFYEYVVNAGLQPAKQVPEKYRIGATTSEELLRELEAAELIETDEDETGHVEEVEGGGKSS